MKLTFSFEAFDRFFYVEAGRIEPAPEPVDQDDEEDAPEVIHLPFGFERPAPASHETEDDGYDEEPKTPEVVCR